MYEELICGFILWIVIFIFIIVTGHEVFSIMVAEKSRDLRLVIHNAPLPATMRTPLMPEPVARYCAWATGTNRNPVGYIHFRHTGRMRFGKSGRWMAMGGEAFFSLATPGFVWHTTISYAPGIWLESLDYYVSHDAGMNLNLFSLIPLNNSHDPEIKTSSLFRYLAWMPVFPMIHCSSDIIRWENIDELTAKAIIHDGEHSAEAIVRFNKRGMIESAGIDKKLHQSTGGPVPGPVECRFSSYSEMRGYQIPLEIASEFILPGGEQAFFEYSIAEIGLDHTGKKNEA
nr:DUF6544 family protein [uncultured Methanoregula sp.]